MRSWPWKRIALWAAGALGVMVCLAGLWVVLLLNAFSDVAEELRKPPQRNGPPPCGVEGRARVELGRPWFSPARFPTSGALVYATATGFSHGGVFDPDVGRTRLYLGEGEPRDYSTAGNPRPSNTTEEVTIIEDDFSSFRLPAGTYWLLTTNSVDIALVSCVPGGVGP